MWNGQAWQCVYRRVFEQANKVNCQGAGGNDVLQKVWKKIS